MKTLELEIGNRVYEFKAGIGFMREINDRMKRDVEGVKGAKTSVGLRYFTALLIDGDVDALIEILWTMNKGFDPRVTKTDLENYIEDIEDIDVLFQKVIDFLSRSNACKKVVTALIEAVDKKAEQTDQ